MNVRARIIIIGRVQKAGYRDYVDENAFNLGLKGYVKNLADGTVEIVCEAEKQNIEKFVEKIKVRAYPIFVENVKVEYSKATDEFKQFDIIREENITEATYERMDAAARYMREMHKDLKGEIGSMHQDLKSELKGFREETNQQFTAMKTDYGKISVYMEKIIEGMAQDRKDFRDAIEKLANAIASRK